MTGATPNPDRALTPLAIHCTYNGTAWSAPSVVSRERQQLPVTSAGVQYGFSVFEGLKVYRQRSGGTALFQVEQHAHRLQQSAARLGLPEVPRALFKAACEVAADAHADVLPPSGTGGLYLRPLLVTPDEHLCVSIPQTADLVISAMTCADRPPTAKRLWVETELVRAWPGGVGAVKTAANYAAGLMGLIRAHKHGCDDVLWLEGRSNATVTEASTSNLFVELGGTFVTPRLNGLLLPGVTRASVITILKSLKRPVRETELSLSELLRAGRAGAIGECFLTGTLSGITPVAAIQVGGLTLKPRPGRIAPLVGERLSAWHRGEATP